MFTSRDTSPTFVVSAELLFVVVDSLSFPATLAVFWIIPAVVVVTTKVMVALAPFTNVPMLHVKTPLEGGLQVPWVVFTELKVTFDGNVSVNVTPVAVSGPLLVTVMVKVAWSPTSTGFGETVWVTWMSVTDAAGFTVVVVVALLLAVSGSPVLLVTVAVLVSEPAVVGETTMVMVVLAPLAIVPRLQVIVVVPLHVAPFGVTDTKVAPAGSGSVICTLAAALGPALETVIE